MNCPGCNGTNVRALAPGFYECESLIEEFHVQRQPAAPGHPYGAFGFTDQTSVTTRVCGHRFQMAVAMAGAPTCECGTFAIGACAECSKPVCGRRTCGDFDDISNKLLCREHLAASVARAAAERDQVWMDAKPEAAVPASDLSPEERQQQFHAHLATWAQGAAQRLKAANVPWSSEEWAGWILTMARLPTPDWPKGQQGWPRAAVRKSRTVDRDGTIEYEFRPVLFLVTDGTLRVACHVTTKAFAKLTESLLFSLESAGLTAGEQEKLSITNRPVSAVSIDQIFALGGVEVPHHFDASLYRTAHQLEFALTQFRDRGGYIDARRVVEQQMDYWELGVKTEIARVRT